MKEYKRRTVKGRVFGDKVNDSFKELYTILQELEDKIENGTLIELPCKVGDKIYFDTWVGGVNVGVQGHQVIGFNLSALVKRNGAIISTEIPIKAVGIDVFLTKAEAEANIKRSSYER